MTTPDQAGKGGYLRMSVPFSVDNSKLNVLIRTTSTRRVQRVHITYKFVIK